MAVTDLNYMSQALFHPTTVKVVMPEHKTPEKAMYFLHGSLCDAQNCLDNINMQQYADKYKLAIIIPDCGNFFYIDHGPAFGNYGKFVGNELVQVTRKDFNLSYKREDTIIAGFSMGGYGALRNGFKYARNFGTIIAMSPACLFEPSAYQLKETKFAYYKKVFFDEVFKSSNTEDKSDENYRYLLERGIEKGIRLPKIYLGCGLEDDLRQVSDEFAGFLTDNRVEFVYRKEHGGHNYDLWNVLLHDALQWCMD